MNKEKGFKKYQKTPSSHRKVTIALYPNAKGFGFAVVEHPVLFLDYGIATVRPINNASILKRVKRLIEFYKPKTVIVPDPKGKYSNKSLRVKKLLNNIVEHVTSLDNLEVLEDNEGIECFHYSREDVRNVFEQFKATNKYEIAMKIIDWFSELETREPRYRRPWMAEDYNMGMFDAISLILTHRYLTA